MDLIIIREALVLIAGGGQQQGNRPIAPADIPRGLIRLIFDPNLPVGTGLLIDGTTMVAGTGGAGDFTIGIGTAAEALGLPVAPGDPVPDMAPDEKIEDGDIVIANPIENDAAVSYLLMSRYPYTIEAGFKQQLANDREWLIEFDRGGSYGKARYTLPEGRYDFVVTEKGWELSTRSYKVTIDNTQGKDDFNYVVDNRRVTVKPGESQVLESKHPIAVNFHRGDQGDEAVRKNLNKSGTYKIAVNTDTNLLDLYALAPEESEEPAGPVLEGTPLITGQEE
jgi:hypothetical protein